MPIVPTLAVVYSSTSVTAALVASMPHAYVVKGAHGAGMVILVKGEVARSVSCTKEKYRYGC